MENLIEKPVIVELDDEIMKKPEFDEEMFLKMKEEFLKQEALLQEEEAKKAQKKHDIALTNIEKKEIAFH